MNKIPLNRPDPEERSCGGGGCIWGGYTEDCIWGYSCEDVACYLPKRVSWLIVGTAKYVVLGLTAGAAYVVICPLERYGEKK